MSLPIRQKAREMIESNKMEVINNPRSLRNKLFNKNKKITVVTAAYNAEKFIHKTIESVIKQSIGMEKIEFIIVDDCSTDGTAEIVKPFTSKHKNITLVSLKENTGSPGTPRNIGIELSTCEYITFLDADDWLDSTGLEVLYTILNETDDDYVVGKTIKVETKGHSVIGEFASVMERRSISPFDIPHFFYHMGPTAKMMKVSMLRENELGFPDMKFGEDKLFFCDVFFHSQSVSTTTKPIYYVNRTDENPDSLTRATNVLDKRRADIKVIEYIKAKNLPVEQEKVALTRIYEYDIVKTFDSQVFVKSKNKEEFIEILKKAIETSKDLRFNFIEEFKSPFYKAAVELFQEDRIEDFIKLFTWLKGDKNKEYFIQNNLPYYKIPFLKDKYEYIRIPMLARAQDSFVADDKYVQSFEVYGDYINNLNAIIIRDRKRFDNELTCEFQLRGNQGKFIIDIKDLDRLEDSLFTVFIRYNDYQLLNIKRILKNQITFNQRNIEFYTSVANNLGLSIKHLK